MSAEAAARIESGLAAFEDVAVIHEQVGAVAAQVADSTVALLSLSPLIARDSRAVDFVADAMAANAAALAALLALQAAAGRVLDHNTRTLDSMLTHSRKV